MGTKEFQGQAPNFFGQLVLLCYKRFGPQKGQQGSCRINARAILIRSVAME